MANSVCGLLAGVAASAVLASLPAHAQQAQRAETVVAAQLSVRDDCIFSPMAPLLGRIQESRESAFLGTILAGFAGNLAQGALNGVAGAIRRASEEHGYTGVGSDGFMAGRIARSESAGVSTYEMVPTPKCLILAVPGTSGRGGSTATAEAFRAYGWSPEPGISQDELDQSRLEFDQQRAVRLGDIGLAGANPAAYVEIALIPGPEGVMLRPMFVWYRAPIASAGTQVRSTEMLVELATPNHAANADQLGTLFALARIRLPRMQPGSAPLTEAQLEGVGSTYHPYRPSTGLVATQLTALQNAESGVTTAMNAQRTAQRTLAVAQRTRQQSTTAPTIQTAQNAVDDAQYALDQAIVATTTATNLRDTLRAVTGTDETVDSATLGGAEWGDAGRIGATNARVSFVVVREANKFGLAIADALGSQATALGTAVTNELRPQDDWRAVDTTLLSATLEVQAKQALYDAAVTEGDAAKIRTARTALLQAKAAANLAAVAAGEPVPYANLMAEAAAGIP